MKNNHTIKRLVIAFLALFTLPISLHAQDYKHEVSLSIGMFSNSWFYYLFNDSLDAHDPITQVPIGTTSCFGPLSFEFYNRTSSLWSFGVTGVLFEGSIDYYYRDKNAEIINATVMAGAKLHWFNRGHFNMYSKLAAGIALSSAKETYFPPVLPNFQLSLLGIDVMFTKNIGIFVEAGVGEQGLVHGGLCFKCN